ncbi:E3 ubiquitin-protein ligase DZIP3 [Exaiptasia diaphana]|nr:E3 ubiquitin-protein ligase DZIP3 [Exaiptasia diaphana]
MMGNIQSACKLSILISGMATHWATETKEKVNHAKLCRLLYDGGGTAVRSVVDHHCPPATLAATLKAKKPQLQKLRKPKGKVLNIEQWDKLYPSSGTSPSTKDIDITLLFVLIRNICGLTKPATGWDALPPPVDTSTEANLARIKYYRNTVIGHSGNAEVDDIQYEAYWKDISSALVSLGLDQVEIDGFKSRPLGVEDYNRLLKNWQLDETDTKDQLSDIKYSIASGFTNMGEQIRQIQKSATPSETDKLFHQEFRSHISSKCSLYHPNTRAWILEKVKAQVESDFKEVLVIQAGPGMGKSVLAARICQTYRGCQDNLDGFEDFEDSQENQTILGACHFFQHNDPSRNNPRLMLQSVAWQLCRYLPDYKVAVEKVLQSDHMRKRDISVLNCTELFTLLFEEPFSHLGNELTGKLVVVIDALDECCNSLKKEFFQVIRDRLYYLPSWIRFVMTTRPPPSISSHVPGNTTEIDPKASQNTEDLKSFFADKLKELPRLSFDQQQLSHLEQLVDLTDGFFLVASFVIDFLNKTGVHSLTEALERFPKGRGITSVYEDYFSRLRDEITPHLKSEEGFYNMLDAVVKAKSPIEKNIFYDILGLPLKESRIPDNKRKEAVNLLHQLFPVENDHVLPFHKTVIDWLTTGDHDFVAKGDGNEVLANVCYDALMNIKREILKNQNPPTQLTDKEMFAFDFGFDYMEESQSFNETKTLAITADPYVLCTEAICDKNNSDANEFYLANGFYKKAFAERLPAELRPIYYQIQIFLNRNYHPHLHECMCVQKVTFLQCLEFTFRALNLLKIETEDSVFHYLKENCLPYHEKETILQLKLASPMVVTEVLPSDDGFFLGQHWDGQTLVKKYHHDGTFINEVQLDEIYNLTLSPDYKSIVAWYRINSISDNIDIRNVDALGKVTSYKLPNFIKSLHVFGSQPWYIVARCFDNMIYIVEGDTGRLVGDPCAVQQNENVLCVSNVGHILLTKTSIAMFSDILDRAFTDEEKRLCFQMLLTHQNVALKRRDTVSCELFLCNYKELNKRIPIYFRHLRCRCSRIVGREPISRLTYSGHVLFSEDGHLLAFYYARCITIVRTSDGSLYTSVCLCYHGHLFDYDVHILYLSETGIIINGKENIFSFSFTGESRPRDVAFEHVYFFPENPERICFFVSRSSKKPKELWYIKNIQYNQGEATSYYALSFQKYMFFDQ